MSQDELAERIGISPRAYTAWERGEIQDIKATYFFSALRALYGQSERILELTDESTEEDGGSIAEEWLSRTKDDYMVMIERQREQSQLKRLLILLAEGVEPQQAAIIVLEEFQDSARDTHV